MPAAIRADITLAPSPSPAKKNPSKKTKSKPSKSATVDTAPPPVDENRAPQPPPEPVAHEEPPETNPDKPSKQAPKSKTRKRPSEQQQTTREEDNPPQKKQKRSKSKSKPRKTLTSRGRKSVVNNVLADIELQKLKNNNNGRDQPPALVIPLLAAAASENARLKKAWSKEELATLTRLAEAPALASSIVPSHPEIANNNSGDLDFEIIAKFLGRFSTSTQSGQGGGSSVRQQFYQVQRMLNQARRESKKGGNYVDMIVTVLEEDLEGNKGSAHQIQKAVKERFDKVLDKYRGQEGWKATIARVLKSETALFEKSEKTATGYWIWSLKAAEGRTSAEGE